MGDPIEVEAIARAFRNSKSRILIGSVKTNVGHGEAVSGISSIIKVALALERGVIPPTIGVTELNPALHLEQRNLAVVTETTPWPKETIRRASVNSFGYGGANGHVVLEAPPRHLVGDSAHSSHVANHARKAFSQPGLIMPFSAHTRGAIERNVENLRKVYLNAELLPDLSYTLISRRSDLAERAYLLLHPESMHDDLHHQNLQLGPEIVSVSTLPLAFVFTGQGSQWQGMGRELIQHYESFQKAIRALDIALSRLSDPPKWTLECKLILKSDHVCN